MLNTEDRQVMKEFYESSLAGFYNNISFFNFEHAIIRRIYVEVERNHEIGQYETQYFEPEAFKKWIDDETHYALERSHFMDDPVVTRQKVLKAATARAVFLFSDWNFSSVPPFDHKAKTYNDRRNLRCSLREYVKCAGSYSDAHLVSWARVLDQDELSFVPHAKIAISGRL